MFADPARQPEEGPDYWMSISDLMAGLLMIFALMLLAAVYNYREGVDGIREILEVREAVVARLQSELEGGDGSVEVDDNGTVRFMDDVLFAQGSAEVSAAGRVQLAAFARRYLALLMENQEFRSQLREIVIEGHTNDDGSYELNLALSQERAFAVMMVLLEESGEHRAELESLVTANGRSESELIYVSGNPGRVDKARSRRIEIHFRLNDDELLEEVLETVSSSFAR